MSNKRRRPRAVPVSPEVRLLRGQEGLEVREADRAGNLVTIRGAVVVYNKPYTVVDPIGEFEERMAPGVASDVMSGDTRYLYNHKGLVLARTASGTLTLEDSPTALWTNATVDIRNTHANNLVVAVERGDVSQMSVGFVCGRDDWNDDLDQRTVYRFAQMPDVSAVSFAASPTTSVEIAQRMALEMPIESRARVRQALVRVRSGKVLSGENTSKIADAVKLLHAVLTAGDFDPASLLDSEQDGTDDEQVNNGSDSTAAADASGMRLADLDREIAERVSRRADMALTRP